MAVFVNVLQHPLQLFGSTIGSFILVYVFYQRFLHPLSKYPGPFLASLTDVWQAQQFLTLKQPYHLTELHKKYGPFVRYGPDKLSITSESAIPVIYQKSGRSMPKTEYYDAFGAAHPNVFGMRDEYQHSVRRRHMSHSFSMTYVKEMEKYLDMNIKILRQRITQHAHAHETFDLKKALHYYVIDTLGELAFSQAFGVQTATEPESLVPPVIEHSLLAAATGAWPAMTRLLKAWLPLLPSESLHKLFKGRQACADLASRSVQKRQADLMHVKDDEAAIRSQRTDLLTGLIVAKDPETGARLTQTDLETEAFGFIIAGTHTTSATTTLLFYHLLHSPEHLSRLVLEIDKNLPDLGPNEAAFPITLAEASLPFLRNCIKENFRITPVFTMPLARRVMAPEGVVIDGEHIRQGTSVAVCNHAFHHNPSVWGQDHMVFDPDRWEDPRTNERSRLLMQFGLGGRQCIGKTIATTNITKLLSTLLKEFEFELPGNMERADVAKGLYKGKLPSLISVGVSDLEGPLMVRAKVRKAS